MANRLLSGFLRRSSESTDAISIGVRFEFVRITCHLSQGARSLPVRSVQTFGVATDPNNEESFAVLAAISSVPASTFVMSSRLLESHSLCRVRPRRRTALGRGGGTRCASRCKLRLMLLWAKRYDVSFGENTPP